MDFKISFGLADDKYLFKCKTVCFKCGERLNIKAKLNHGTNDFCIKCPACKEVISFEFANELE